MFALETFWPATDGWRAARIEEQLVVTADGCEVITRFPAEELMIAGLGSPHRRRTPAGDPRDGVAQEPGHARLGRRRRPRRRRGDRGVEEPEAVATDVIMPALGMAQETGKVLRWLKAEGDEVAKGEPLDGGRDGQGHR